jgi:hypothetical protein
MAGKTLIRTIRSRFRAAVIFAMMPLAVLSGRVVSGCMSPTGHFELNCRCWAGAGGSAASATSCRCHCSCCAGGKTSCCCQSKSLADRSRQTTTGGGIQGSGRCTPVAFYNVTPAVNVSNQTDDNHQSADFAAIVIDAPASLAQTTIEQLAELDTGPPPDNLVVALHRFLI